MPRPNHRRHPSHTPIISTCHCLYPSHTHASTKLRRVLSRRTTLVRTRCISPSSTTHSRVIPVRLLARSLATSRTGPTHFTPCNHRPSSRRASPRLHFPIHDDLASDAPTVNRKPNLPAHWQSSWRLNNRPSCRATGIMTSWYVFPTDNPLLPWRATPTFLVPFAHRREGYARRHAHCFALALSFCIHETHPRSPHSIGSSFGPVSHACEQMNPAR